MKLKIKCIQNPLWITSVWDVTFADKTERFNSHLAAITYANKVWTRYYKEQAAFSMLQTIAVNMLCISNGDFDLCSKLNKTNCVGITKRQYGYLVGIHERQQKEW